MGFFSDIFGGAPKVSNAAAGSVEEEKKRAKRSRAQLLQTEGGIVGQELTPDQVSGRTTIYGN